ncbi:hypothetical protein AAVH_02883 [Aphelenchoides avenae]|nr:hypothetical protein AAVH_02883 [Aphelenchus avenae]
MADNVFGVLVSGRLPQTNFVQAGETEFVIEIPNATAVNHLCVFLTGAQPFPVDTGGSVYLRLPSADSGPAWHYLGFICNEKPSAIFRIGQLNKPASNQDGLFTGTGMASAIVPSGSAQVGIQVEPLASIQAKIPAQGTAASQQSSQYEFADKMLRNFANYAQSYLISMPRLDNPTTTAEYIEAKVFDKWFTEFQRRLQQNPNFWKSLP